MNNVNASLVFTTLSGHKAVVKPVKAIGGKWEGKWSCKVSGPRISSKRGVKTTYSEPDVTSAKARVASLLKIDPKSIVESSCVDDKPIAVSSPTRTSCKQSPYFQNSEDPLLDVRLDLLQALRNLRKQLAQSKKLPVHMIFDNKTLNELVIRLPMSNTELLTIRGIGPKRAKEHGAAILEVIRNDRRDWYGPDEVHEGA
jgi:superfamily II DNA helicase RecQ